MKGTKTAPGQALAFRPAVKEAIALLSKMPDKEMTMMVDCPYCGRANQLATIGEVVVLRSKPAKEEL